MNDITLPARILFHLGPMPITDGFLGAVIVSATLILAFFFASRRFAIVPTRIQLILELVTDYIMDQLVNAFGDEARARAFYPLFMTMLLFILLSNQFVLIPLVFEITYNGFDVIRQPTSDLAMPLAFSIMIFGISQYMAFKISPLRHLGNFIAIEPLLKSRTVMEAFNAVIGLFIGVLNVVGEFAKVVSLACRLFGNVFAGNVMAAVIIGLSTYTQFIVPIPFLILGVFSGLVQSFVFMLLSIQFVALAIDGAKAPEPELQEQEAAA